MKNLHVFGKEIIDEKSIQQIQNCIGDEDYGVLTADAHYGYGHPIGGAVAYKNHISLSGVGFDIACGNKAVKTDLKSSDLDSREIVRIMNEIYNRISFGIGRPNNEPVDHEVFDKIANADFVPQRMFLQLAKNQLGTVGSGNHYIDLFVDYNGYIWIGVHFGSRGFGHKTTTGFIALSQGLGFSDKGKEGSMDSKPILFDLNSQIGQDYLSAMNLAGEYAYAGRDCVVNKVLEIIGNPNVLFEVHNHHNFAWMEEHFGDKYCVVRKGCTPAFPNQFGFIGSNMVDDSIIVKGIDSELSKTGLYSTVHGAGRIMSRNEAAGKKKWIFNEEKQRKIPTIISKGKVNFDTVKATMQSLDIVLRGAGADEAPECYKKLSEVIKYQGDTIEIVNVLRPIGVAMAGSEVYDPYKD